MADAYTVPKYNRSTAAGTLSGLAREKGTTVQAIVDANKGNSGIYYSGNDARLREGATLNFPGQTTATAPTAPVGDTTTTPGSTGKDGYYSRVTTDRQKELDRLTGIVGDYDEPNLGKTRDQLMQMNKGIIDAITTEYANTIGEERVRGQKLDKRQRAVNIGSGLAGSDFAGANAQAVEDQTLKAVQSIERERDAKIQSVLSDTAFRATEMFKAEQDKYRQNAEESIARFAKFKEDALDDVNTFANSGISSSDLREKDPDTWANLLKQTGYSDQALTAAFAAARPEQDKVFEEKIGNSIVIGYRDPATGKISTEKVSLGEGYSDFKIIGGQPYFVDMEGGKITSATGYKGGTGGGGKSIKDGSLVLSGTQVNAIENELQKSKTLYEGDGKYVNPQVYQATLTDWIANGGTQKGFLAQFPPNKYVNPSNTNLPVYLQNPTGRTSGGSTTTVTNPFAKTTK